MRSINLQLGFSSGISIDVTKLDPSQADENGRILAGTMDVQAHREEVETARQNGAQIVWAALEIEKSMESIISNHMFFPVGINLSRDFFSKEILGGSFFGFAPKKMLIQKIVNERNLLSGGKGEKNERNRLNGALKAVMIVRNAFAHGHITAMQGEGCILEYFSGDKQTARLTDEYWEKVESGFSDSKRLLQKAGDGLLEQLRQVWSMRENGQPMILRK